MDIKKIAEATGGTQIKPEDEPVWRLTMENVDKEIKRLAPALKRLKDL